MPRKEKPKPDNIEQSARFIEAAKQIDNPDAKEAFEEAIKKVVKKKLQTIDSLVIQDKSNI